METTTYTRAGINTSYQDFQIRQTALDLAIRFAECGTDRPTSSGVIAAASSFYEFLKRDQT